MDPLVGAVISHYRVLEQIGAGGMGVVYVGEDERLHRKVALKFIAPASAGDVIARKRLLHEAQAASALDHPNIATLYEVGDLGDRLFIAMAYYQGETLKQRLDRGPLPISDAAATAQHIAEGLSAAHASGVVHRDLKPANIFLTSSGQVKIVDFGLAKIDAPTIETTTHVTQAGTILGTLSYMSPEQARGEHVDQRTDVWALGVMLFEMLTGSRPFKGESTTAVLTALATAPAPRVTSLRPDAPAELARLVERALVKDPGSRTITASEMARGIGAYRDRVAAAPSIWRSVRRPIVALPVAAAVALFGATGVVVFRNRANQRWAKDIALPEIARLADREEYVAAVDLANQVQPLLRGDAELAALWPRIARTITVGSTPPGATISYSTYAAGGAWRAIGVTPLKGVRLPKGVVRVRAEKPDCDTAEDVSYEWFDDPTFMLLPPKQAPEGMVRAAPTQGATVFVFGLQMPRVPLNGFWIDRYEVTNRQYKAFVDAGGYTRPDLWQQPFVKNGRTLSFEEAMSLFVDATGRAGPAAWTIGNYPPGGEGLPVTGVSWYEAQAYATFAGRALPTAYHWYYVADQDLSGNAIPLGNFSSPGPVPVAETRALHHFGAYGMAGNVKEWCTNEAPGGLRYILGGGWDEPPYMFRDTDARSPFERGANMGFRTVKYDDGDTTVAAASGVLRPPSRSYASEKPVGVDVFEAYRRLYSYDATPLASRVESVDDTNPDWRVEKISFAAAYGPERMIAYLLLPKRGAAPYQTVVFMPGSAAWYVDTSPDLASLEFGFLLKSGRAVALPIYKGSYERASHEYNGDQSKSTSLWRDYVIMFSKDFGRTLDYLATRSEIDGKRIGFFGYSRGASLAPVFLAREPRIKAAVLWLPGFYFEKVAPETDPLNFAPRVIAPILQLSGRYDYNFPDPTSSLPFFGALGTPADRKRRVVYDTGHNLPSNEAIRETLDWFDRYLGPVR